MNDEQPAECAAVMCDGAGPAAMHVTIPSWVVGNSTFLSAANDNDGEKVLFDSELG